MYVGGIRGCKILSSQWNEKHRVYPRNTTKAWIIVDNYNRHILKFIVSNYETSCKKNIYEALKYE